MSSTLEPSVERDGLAGAAGFAHWSDARFLSLLLGAVAAGASLGLPRAAAGSLYTRSRVASVIRLGGKSHFRDPTVRGVVAWA